MPSLRLARTRSIGAGSGAAAAAATSGSAAAGRGRVHISSTQDKGKGRAKEQDDEEEHDVDDMGVLGRHGGARYRRSQPPTKRRRLLQHSASTVDENASSDSSLSSPSSSSSSSDEHDNEDDDDYVNTATTEDEARPRAAGGASKEKKHGTSRKSGGDAKAAKRHQRGSSARRTSVLEHSDTSSSAAETSARSSLSPKPLSPLEVNAARRKQRRRSNGTAAQIAATKKGRSAVAKIRREMPFANTLARFSNSPVKLLPANQRYAASGTIAGRNFQVRPDLPFGSAASRTLPSAATGSNNVGRSFQAGFRKIAGKVMQRANGGKRSDLPAHAVASDTVRIPGSTSNGSLNGKRKREEKDRMSRSTSRVSLQRSASPAVAPEPDQAAMAGFQPLRRTRSIARKIERLGVLVSESHSPVEEEDGEEEVEDDVEGQTLETAGVERHEEDSDGESIERSIASMSLDEIPDQDEEEEETDSNASASEEPDSAYLLQSASMAQLHRLRKDKLLRLVEQLSGDEDESRVDFTKDGLVKIILDNRRIAEEGEEEELQHQPSSSSSVEGDDDEEDEQDVEDEEEDTLSTRRQSSRSMAYSSAPVSISPRKSPRTNRSHRNQRSRSYPPVDQSDAASSSDDDAGDASRLPHNADPFADAPAARHSRKRSSNSGRGASAGATGLGNGRPDAVASRTPGRLRSGKLRASSASMLSSSDQDEEISAPAPTAEMDEDDMPTPVARRTRHRRNISTLSASSAGFGDEDDEDLPNQEYRLRKVSLPRKAKKRGSIVELTSEEEGAAEQEEEEEQEPEEDPQATGLRRSRRSSRAGSLRGESQHDLVSFAEEDEEDEDGKEDDAASTADFDLGEATLSSLLKLKRDALVKLSEDRELGTDGTKRDMAIGLLKWHQSQADEESPDSSEAEGDMSVVSAEGDEEAGDGNDDAQEREEDDEGSENSDSSLSSAGSDSTIRRARNETKTQALAKLSNRRQSYDSGSQQKPILLQSQQDHNPPHSKKIDTPPGSGDQQNNDLELDLESLNLVDKEIHPDKIKKGEKIGSGGFKDVYEGKYRNVKVALADIRGHLTENDLKELGLLRDLRHANVVRFIGVVIPVERDVPVCIVTELCSNGDLFDYIRNTPPPPLEKILGIMLDIAKGLDYLHKRKPTIVHRDMKSSNVLITARGVAKIADFGLARVRNSTRSIIKSLVGTVNWQAPELWVAHPRYNEKVDVYSAALVFWECLQWHLSQKRYPFEGMNEHAIYHEVGGKQFRPSTATMRRQWGGEPLDLIDRMWAQDPKQRPDMSEVVKDLEGLIKAEKARARAAAH